MIIEDDLDSLLERYEATVDISEIPSEDEYLAKLSHHALLDRIPNTSDLIGFINDFIFGYLIADSIVHDKQDITNVSSIGINPTALCER